MKIKNYLIILLSVIIIISALTTIFRKKYKVVIINDLNPFAFSDSITFVSYSKDDDGSGIETKVKNYDTPFCFSGFNAKLHLSYPEYARKGDIILKKKNADTFYIKRNNDTINFVMSKCQ